MTHAIRKIRMRKKEIKRHFMQKQKQKDITTIRQNFFCLTSSWAQLYSEVKEVPKKRKDILSDKHL